MTINESSPTPEEESIAVLTSAASEEIYRVTEYYKTYFNQKINELNLEKSQLQHQFDVYRDTNPLFQLPTQKYIWALQQIESVDELTTVETWLVDAINTGIPLDGFCLRMGWRNYAQDRSVLDRALEMCRRHRLKFAFRFMAGVHTPAEFVGPSVQLGGQPCPVPFDAEGNMNGTFENAYYVLILELVDWYQANDVHLLHNSWYAGKWSELNHGLEIREAPGYTIERFIEGHLRLIDIVSALVGPRRIVTEFPATGHGPSKVVSAAINEHLAHMFGAGSRRAVLQLNGWSHTNVVGGATPPTAQEDFARLAAEPSVLKALQAIQPWGIGKHLQYTSDQAREALRRADGINAQYIELYLPTLLSKNDGINWVAPLNEWRLR